MLCNFKILLSLYVWYIPVVPDVFFFIFSDIFFMKQFYRDAGLKEIYLILDSDYVLLKYSRNIFSTMPQFYF